MNAPDDAQCLPEELDRMRRQGDDIVLLDVRTAPELACAALDGAIHLPLHQLAERFDELEPLRERRIVVFCHHGARSEMARQFLEQQGFARARNLVGGIDAYAATVDPSIPRY